MAEILTVKSLCGWGCIDRRSKESTEAHVAAWFGYADALATVLRQLQSEELGRISYLY